MYYVLSQCNLWFLFAGGVRHPAEELARDTEDQISDLKRCLQVWRDKVKQCNPYALRWNKCLPCSNGQQCISLTGAREFFKQLKDEQIGIICENFKLAFIQPVCTQTPKWDKGWTSDQTLTPPWGLLGLGYSLRDCLSTNANYSSNPALGTLAERLMEQGMLAVAGEDDHQSDGGAGQQPYHVDAGSV